MSNTPMIIMLAVGFSALVVFACMFLFVLFRLRRVIKAQAEALEKMVGAVQASQSQDRTGRSPQQPS